MTVVHRDSGLVHPGTLRVVKESGKVEELNPSFFCLVCYIRSVALKHLWRTCEVFNFTMTCKDRKMSEKGDSTTDTF